MDGPRIPLLMTRPRGAAERFVAQLPDSVQDRIAPVWSPLIRITACADEPGLGDARGVIFSSANGVDIVSGLTARRDLPACCVGEATAQAARVSGWRVVRVAPTADDLVRALLRDPPDGPLVHLRGMHARGQIAERLADAGHPAWSREIYDQQLQPLTKAAQTVLAGTAPVIAPLFSPRTARQFVDSVAPGAPLYLAALSPAVAEPLSGLDFRALEVAVRPDAAAMTDAVEALVNRVWRVEGGRDAQ